MSQRPMRKAPQSALPFALVTLLPAALLAAGAVLGGVWVAAALSYMTLFTALMDRVLARFGNAPEGAEFPAAGALSLALALVHLALLPLAAAAVAGATGLGPGARAALFLGAGLFFGQVSNSNAHELIHRGARGLRRLGAAVYATLLFGHHASAHPLVHHRHVATAADPNSARAGESFYAFAPRAWAGSFRAGWRAETALRRRAPPGRRGLWWGVHPYAVYLGGAAACLAGAGLALGWAGMLAWAGLAAHAQMQLLLSDYVQHYGLERRAVAGRAEPVGPAHSWDAPQPFSGLLMLNAPRHADHHLQPGRIYPALRLDPGRVPMLPRGLPAMATLALFPGAWRRAMDGRLARWQARRATTDP